MIAGTFAAVLVAATALSTWQAVVARDAKHQAEVDRDRAKSSERRAKTEQARAQAAEGLAATEAAIARAVNAFLQEDLLGQVASAPPGWEPGGARLLTVKEVLDRAAARIGGRFQDQPLVEAAIRTAIGNGYHSLCEFPSAVSHLEEALKLRKARLGLDHMDTRDSMDKLAREYRWLARHSESIALRRQVLESSRTVLGPDHPETRHHVRALAEAYQCGGQDDKAEPIAREAVAMNRTGDFKFPYWVSILGAVLLGQKKYAEAEPLLLKGYEGMKHWQNLNLESKWRMTEVGRWIIYLYDASNQPEKARMWRARIEAESQAAGKLKEVLWKPNRGPSPRDFP